MGRGFFTQGTVVLTDGRCTIADLAEALGAAGYLVRWPDAPPDPASWPFGGPTVVVPYRPEVNGSVAIDLVDHPWPDSMGDPEGESMVFGAWALGHFGPFAFPGGLKRAVQQAWGWPGAADVVAKHTSFVRVRFSYVFGAEPDTPVMPADWEPLAELALMNEIVRALLGVPGVLCSFNPNGEVLLPPDDFGRIVDECRAGGHVPLDVWANVRFVRLDEDFGLMDTVGNAQLEVPDFEAIFPLAEYDANDVAYYLRNVSLYALKDGASIIDGDSIDGPQENDLGWILRGPLERGTLDPPRELFRICPNRDKARIRAVIEPSGE